MSGDKRLAERVLFVERSLLEKNGVLSHGFSEDEVGAYSLINECGEFLPRSVLEEDPSRKQAIPYVVVHDDTGRVLAMSRKSTQTEARLHGKISIGIGGHIPDEIRDAVDQLHAGMLRELHEELHIPEGVSPVYRGLLNDDSNSVGQVHLGLVFTCLAEPEDVSVRETDKMAGEWMDQKGLWDARDRLETWSDLLLEHLDTWTTS